MLMNTTHTNWIFQHRKIGMPFFWILEWPLSSGYNECPLHNSLVTPCGLLSLTLCHIYVMSVNLWNKPEKRAWMSLLLNHKVAFVVSQGYYYVILVIPTQIKWNTVQQKKEVWNVLFWILEWPLYIVTFREHPHPLLWYHLGSADAIESMK